MNTSRAILVCTLGQSWAVVPEIYAFLAPLELPLYRYHPGRDRLVELRREYGLVPPDEIIIVTTEGEKTCRSLNMLAEWWRLLGCPKPMRVWQAAGTNELAGEGECRLMRELIMRAVLDATHRAGADGQVVLSLAGGRKTMSADLQSAGTIFGCRAMLHVVDSGEFPVELRFARPEFLVRPLPASIRSRPNNNDQTPLRDMPCAGSVTPLVVGRGRRGDLLDVPWNDRPPVAAHRFPLPRPGDITARPLACSWRPADREAWLTAEIDAREQEGQRLLGNYLAELSRAEHHENWRTLYRLPPRLIESLRREIIGPRCREWLASIPMAELHCHLGGVLDVAAQKRVGEAVWEALGRRERQAALERVKKLLRAGEKWPWEWPDMLRRCEGGTTDREAAAGRTANAAAVLVALSGDELTERLYDLDVPRFALRDSRYGFAAYERPGELAGSAILGHPVAVDAYAAEVYRIFRNANLLYAELRGSPMKYLGGDGLMFLRRFRAGLDKAREDAGDPGPAAGGIDIRFIIIADRRDVDEKLTTAEQASRLEAAARLTVAAMDDKELQSFVVGLDLAGDEAVGGAEAVAKHFHEAFERCLPITIHAGEGTSVNGIWSAAYHLHADRVGHGLSLVDNPDLAARFRNRDICIELCPTSNMEVVGFHDPCLAGRQARPDGTGHGCDRSYPLKKLWELGLPLTICTDNPGISRTDLVNEYIVVSRLAGGISRWDALAMIKQAFTHAFLPAAEREALVKRADRMIFTALSAREDT